MASKNEAPASPRASLLLYAVYTLSMRVPPRLRLIWQHGPSRRASLVWAVHILKAPCCLPEASGNAVFLTKMAQEVEALEVEASEAEALEAEALEEKGMLEQAKQPALIDSWDCEDWKEHERRVETGKRWEGMGKRWAPWSAVLKKYCWYDMPLFWGGRLIRQ